MSDKPKRAVAAVLNGTSLSDLAVEINMFHKGQIIQLLSPSRISDAGGMQWWQMLILYIPNQGEENA
jgi:hypothetical protein